MTSPRTRCADGRASTGPSDPLRTQRETEENEENEEKKKRKKIGRESNPGPLPSVRRSRTRQPTEPSMPRHSATGSEDTRLTSAWRRRRTADSSSENRNGQSAGSNAHCHGNGGADGRGPDIRFREPADSSSEIRDGQSAGSRARCHGDGRARWARPRHPIPRNGGRPMGEEYGGRVRPSPSHNKRVPTANHRRDATPRHGTQGVRTKTTQRDVMAEAPDAVRPGPMLTTTRRGAE